MQQHACEQCAHGGAKRRHRVVAGTGWQQVLGGSRYCVAAGTGWQRHWARVGENWHQAIAAWQACAQSHACACACACAQACAQSQACACACAEACAYGSPIGESQAARLGRLNTDGKPHTEAALCLAGAHTCAAWGWLSSKHALLQPIQHKCPTQWSCLQLNTPERAGLQAPSCPSPHTHTHTHTHTHACSHIRVTQTHLRH